MAFVSAPSGPSKADLLLRIKTNTPKMAYQQYLALKVIGLRLFNEVWNSPLNEGGVPLYTPQEALNSFGLGGVDAVGAVMSSSALRDFILAFEAANNLPSDPMYLVPPKSLTLNADGTVTVEA